MSGERVCVFRRTLHSSGLTLKQARRYWSGLGVLLYPSYPLGLVDSLLLL